MSTNRKYNFRVTQDIDLYANYGTVQETYGVTTTSNGIDVYYDSAGNRKLRLNTMMNPYGFAETGTSTGNPNITDVAVAYLKLNNDKVLSAEEFSQIQTDIKSALDNINYNGAAKFTTTVSVENIGTITLISRKIDDNVQLTNKNRIQFVGTYPASGNENNKVIALTSLKYHDENNAENLNKWYVSDNYITHNLSTL